MPNWCSNSLKVEGSPNELVAFKEAMEGNDRYGEHKVLSEENILPYPKDFEEQDKKAEEYNKKRDAFLESIKEFPEREKNQRWKEWSEDNPRVKDGYNAGGYTWENDNWGTKWGFVEPNLSNFNPASEEMYYSFSSAWSPPEGLVRKMAEMYPQLKFTLDYEEPGMGFGGILSFQEGEELEHDQYDLQYCPDEDCGTVIPQGEDTCPECGRKVGEDIETEKVQEWEQRWKRGSKMDIPNLDYSVLNKKAQKKQTKVAVGPGDHGSVRISLDDDEIAIVKEDYADELAKGEITLSGNELWVSEGDEEKWKGNLGIITGKKKLIVENIEVTAEEAGIA